MAQFARPDSDVAAGGWTPQGGPVTLFDALNEITPDDLDFIESANNPALDTSEVGLSNVDDPAVSTGHVLRYRYAKDTAGGRQIDLTVTLLQGATTIASFNHVNISDVITQQNQTLTGPQADAITDYTDLRIEFIADAVGGGGARAGQVMWAEFEVPLQLSGTIVSVSTLLGTLIATVPLAGSIQGQSAGSGSINVGHRLRGTVNGVSVLSGSLNIPRVLQGSLDGQSSLAGALSVAKSLAGVVPGASTMQGRILLDFEIAGVIPGVSTLSGTMVATVCLKGTIDAVGNAQGRLSRAFNIQSISNTFSDVEALLRLALMIRGVINGQSALDARLRLAGERITTSVGGKVNPLITVGGKVANES